MAMDITNEVSSSFFFSFDLSWLKGKTFVLQYMFHKAHFPTNIHLVVNFEAVGRQVEMLYNVVSMPKPTNRCKC